MAVIRRPRRIPQCANGQLPHTRLVAAQFRLVMGVAFLKRGRPDARLAAVTALRPIEWATLT